MAEHTRSGPGRGRGLALVTALSTLPLAVSCGAAGTSHPSRTPELEPVTTAGLAAAAMVHLDGERARVVGGSQHPGEGWTAVDFTVRTATRTVELSVFVTRVTADQSPDPQPPGPCPTSETVLWCHVVEAPGGAAVALQSSTEDIVGGAFTTGFSAEAVHLHDHSLVLVSEVVPTRDRASVRMTHLAVPVEVLVEIAADPLVGTRTTAELNKAGARAFRDVYFDDKR